MSNENGPALLDREGIFKAKPFDWRVEPAKDGSQAVGVSVGFLIDSQLEGDAWTSWADYEPQMIRGWFYVTKKTGAINQSAIDQLVLSLGWDCNFKTITTTDPPDVIVQINCKYETWEQKRTLKVKWLNPEDYVPTFAGASDEDATKLQTQFGSLLRAAGAAAAKKNGGKTFPPPRPKSEPADGDVPF